MSFPDYQLPSLQKVSVVTERKVNKLVTFCRICWHGCLHTPPFAGQIATVLRLNSLPNHELDRQNLYNNFENRMVSILCICLTSMQKNRTLLQNPKHHSMPFLSGSRNDPLCAIEGMYAPVNFTIVRSLCDLSFMCILGTGEGRSH